MFVHWPRRGCPLHAPLISLDSMNAYNFVTCQLQGAGGIAFKELISVYDGYIWIYLACSMIILSATIASGIQLLREKLHLFLPKTETNL